MNKPRLLWMGEATFLNTGYGVYGRELLSRLHATGAYVIAELGSYGHYADPRGNKVPWVYYGCLPDDSSQKSTYDSRVSNQWGAWRFDEVCLDFRPTHVIDIRDWWYGEYVDRSPFRRLFNWGIMPTIDSAPQMEQWLATYMNADYVCAYCEYGRDTLLKETNGLVKFADLAPPAADYDVFCPVKDKNEHKSMMGLDKDSRIVGTIMRNQKRKLYPDLIESFARFVVQYPTVSHNVFLYLHTSYPDIGWDIPRLIRESGVGHRILCTYVCKKCGHVFLSFFQDAVQACQKCGAYSASLPSSGSEINSKQLSDIINCFDVYVQYSVAEGLGVPQVEATACGVPIMSVDYSAMSSVVRNLDGIPIPVQRMFREAESHSYRAYPDNDAFIQKLYHFFRMSEEHRKIRWHNLPELCKTHYSWEKTTEVWRKFLDDNSEKPSWTTSPNLAPLNMNVPNGLSNDEFVKWCITYIWGEPSQINSYIALRLVRDLNYGECVHGYGGVHYSEDSLLSTTPKFQKFGRSDVIKAMVELGNIKNNWEMRRVTATSNDDVPMYIRNARSQRRTKYDE